MKFVSVEAARRLKKQAKDLREDLIICLRCNETFIKR